MLICLCRDNISWKIQSVFRICTCLYYFQLLFSVKFSKTTCNSLSFVVIIKKQNKALSYIMKDGYA